MKQQLAIWKQILIIAVICSLGYGAWYERARIAQLTGLSLGEDGKPKVRRNRADQRVPVIVEAVKMVKAIDRLQAIGDGLAKRSVTIFPEVTGLVAASISPRARQSRRATLS